MHGSPTPGVAPSNGQTERSAEQPATTGILGKLLRIRTFEALQYRDFHLLWMGQMGIAMGTWMDQLARGWLLYQLTDSALQLGLVRAMQAIPFLLLSPLAGVLADRYGRKGQLLVAQSIDGCLYALMAVLIFTEHIQPWHVYATALGTAVVSVFQQPARQAMVSEAVPVHHLTNAIGLDSLIFNVSRSTGPALAGVLIALIGTGGSYAAQATLYAASTLWTAQIRLPARTARPDSGRYSHARSFVGGTAEGWRFMVSNEAVRTGMVIAMLASLLAQPFATLLPIFARDILQIGPTGQGLLLTAMGVGAVTSAILIASISNELPKGLLMICGATVYGLALIGFAVSPWFAASLVLMALIGLCNVACHALVRTIVQTHSPRELQGRMMGLFQQTQVVYTVGSLLAGTLATLFGAPATVVLMGASTALSGVTIAFAFPRARFIR